MNLIKETNLDPKEDFYQDNEILLASDLSEYPVQLLHPYSLLGMEAGGREYKFITINQQSLPNNRKFTLSLRGDL